jgi:SAM-dependent methyltransferase
VTSSPAPVPPPAVDPAVYDHDYFTSGCAGSYEWTESGGRAVGGIYHFALAQTRFKAGQILVDIGTGRGELPALAAEQGASRAYGVEYSQAALDLAAMTASAHKVTSTVDLVLADARRIPLPDGCADAVTMLDVVEHLTPTELDASLREARRLLAPAGRLFIHTFPSRTVYEFTYRLQRWALPWRLWRWPHDPRKPVERLMHVNEQSVSRLRRSVRRAGLSIESSALGEWVYVDFVPNKRARALYHRVARIPGLRQFGVANMWLVAQRG